MNGQLPEFTETCGALNVTMNFAKAALPLALASAVRAFSPAARAAFYPAATTARAFAAVGGGTVAPSSRRSISSTTALNANVLKLTQPAKELLPDVDVFIFDCDGVIWRVSGGALVWSDIFVEKARNSITGSEEAGQPVTVVVRASFFCSGCDSNFFCQIPVKLC